MARIIQFNVNSGEIIRDLPSANTGLFIDADGNPLPGVLINPDTSALDGVVEKKFWIVDLNLLIVREMSQAEKNAILVEEQAEAKRVEALTRVERGRSIIAELEAEMVRLNLSDEMKSDIITSIHDIIIMLVSGQLAKAKELVLNLQPGGKLTQNMINKLQAFIAKEIL